ncbi:Shedu immune nuclease family protein [Primorskyibacter sp. 2E107]|uniref:Shedu immune nuclease family protein n=1 Tax=Primorskyibacter sp. 2E107 TaxID=3403458 RepID=UPI003AF6AD4D
MSDERDFFRLRRAAKTYISKVFTYGAHTTDRLRNVRMVMDGSDVLHLGEVEGALCLRLSGEKRRTQVTAVVTQDDKAVRRLTLQSFQTRKGDWYQGYEEHAFTFRGDEFQRLLTFLDRLAFIDLANEDRFDIEDISTGAGRKAIVDAADRGIVERLRAMSDDDREALLRALHGSLSPEEVNILLGRRQALEAFEQRVEDGAWSEREWQDFFDREPWVFGYGLDYRIMRPFDREATVSGGGTDNRGKPVVDFLMSFTDYTVLVEIKRPDTPIFRAAPGGVGGRAGTRAFSAEFTGAVSQILEQKAEWMAFAASGEHFSRDGTRRLEARTRNAKTILVIGNRREFEAAGDLRAAQVMRDTFELFRRETRSIDIVTFDELLERARFITHDGRS